MKRDEIADVREAHSAEQIGPASAGNNVRCMSNEHPEGGVPWPCVQARLVLHIDTVERQVRAAANRVLIDTGIQRLEKIVREAAET
jgi:hypothetical protein